MPERPLGPDGLGGGAEAPLTTGRFLAFSAAFGMFIASTTELTGTAIDLVRLVPTWEREPIEGMVTVTNAAQ